jgi:type II secretory pathway predicted ATPase ExeA
MDFTTYYGLTHNPFDKESDAVLETVDFKEMQFRLNYLKDTLGIGLITGNPGVGKSFALRKFAEDLNPNLYKVCYLPLSTVSINDFYNSLAISLGLEPKNRKIDKFNQIQERITNLYESSRITPVIIIDEAQYLKGTILQELALLLNFNMDSRKNCILILTGLPQLAQTLSRAQFEPLKQRIITQYEFGGLEREDVASYIETMVKSANGKAKIFTESSFDALGSNAGKSIRKLNNLVTQSMIIGAKRKKKTIDIEIVYDANSEITIL